MYIYMQQQLKFITISLSFPTSRHQSLSYHYMCVETDGLSFNHMPPALPSFIIKTITNFLYFAYNFIC